MFVDVTLKQKKKKIILLIYIKKEKRKKEGHMFLYTNTCNII